MKSQSIEVKLAGQKISLKTTADAERVKEITLLVSSRIRLAESRAKGGMPSHVALLALFDLAEEYLNARDRLKEKQTRLESKTQQILQTLEVELRT